MSGKKADRYLVNVAISRLIEQVNNERKKGSDYEVQVLSRIYKDMMSKPMIEVDILTHKDIAANPADRCYYCKKLLFSNLLAAAQKDGFYLLIDGTNASDNAAIRPGMRALKELNIRSPLRECNISKEKVRMLSKKMGLSTWNKAPYACLATRFPTETVITKEGLLAIEKGEEFLKNLGFSNLRLRFFHGAARLQLPKKELARAIKNREAILNGLAEFFPIVLLDLTPRTQ